MCPRPLRPPGSTDCSSRKCFSRQRPRAALAVNLCRDFHPGTGDYWTSPNGATYFSPTGRWQANTNDVEYSKLPQEDNTWGGSAYREANHAVNSNLYDRNTRQPYPSEQSMPMTNSPARRSGSTSSASRERQERDLSRWATPPSEYEDSPAPRGSQTYANRESFEFYNPQRASNSNSNVIPNTHPASMQQSEDGSAFPPSATSHFPAADQTANYPLARAHIPSPTMAIAVAPLLLQQGPQPVNLGDGNAHLHDRLAPPLQEGYQQSWTRPSPAATPLSVQLPISIPLAALDPTSDIAPGTIFTLPGTYEVQLIYVGETPPNGQKAQTLGYLTNTIEHYSYPANSPANAVSAPTSPPVAPVGMQRNGSLLSSSDRNVSDISARAGKSAKQRKRAEQQRHAATRLLFEGLLCRRRLLPPPPTADGSTSTLPDSSLTRKSINHDYKKVAKSAHADFLLNTEDSVVYVPIATQVLSSYARQAADEPLRYIQSEKTPKTVDVHDQWQTSTKSSKNVKRQQIENNMLKRKFHFSYGDQIDRDFGCIWMLRGAYEECVEYEQALRKDYKPYRSAEVNYAIDGATLTDDRIHVESNDDCTSFYRDVRRGVALCVSNEGERAGLRKEDVKKFGGVFHGGANEVAFYRQDPFNSVEYTVESDNAAVQDSRRPNQNSKRKGKRADQRSNAETEFRFAEFEDAMDTRTP